VKCGANYQNVRLAQIQAHVDGYDDALLLNGEGNVCEAPIANVFLVRDAVVVTPDRTSGILEGITRRTLVESAGELGVVIVEQEVNRTELYVADEIFLAGTGTDVWPVVSVDHYPVGSGTAGPITTRVQQRFGRLVRGKLGHEEWLTGVYRRAPLAG
jgi:branched-chain amino acid aminotransferase